MLSSHPMHANGQRLHSPRARRPRQEHPATPAWAALAAAALPLLLACGASDSAAAASNTGVGDVGDGTSGADRPSPSTDTPASEAPTTPASEAPNGVYAGTYVVPIEAELEAYARFDVSAVRFDVDGAELGLRYDLPELLLGQARRISFRGTADAAGVYQLAGDAGTASCRRDSNDWVCDEVLRSVELDTNKLDRLLSTLPEAEAQARRSVADRFIVDPIGVLHVQMR
jgi:hypothetical protein